MDLLLSDTDILASRSEEWARVIQKYKERCEATITLCIKRDPKLALEFYKMKYGTYHLKETMRVMITSVHSPLPSSKKIVVRHQIPVYSYMDYITEAIREGTDFKYQEVNQLGARLSGKTTSDNVELVRAIIEAHKQRKLMVVVILRMRHKEQINA